MTKDIRVVLLNGPPRCGKSTAANTLSMFFNDAAAIGFSRHLKRMVHAIYGLRLDTDPEAFDSCKDAPNETFLGLSPRQAYITWSEKAAKVFHGDEFFGEMWLRAARTSGRSVIFVPDCGFRSEALPGVRALGSSKFVLYQIERDGCTFDGDSRSRIDLTDLGVPLFRVQNNGDIAAFGQKMIKLVQRDLARWS